MKRVSQPVSLRLEPLGRLGIPPFMLSSEAPLVIGRAKECDLCLPDPGISRRHAMFSWRGEHWFLTDLGSRCGSYLNSVQLQPATPTIAAPGDLVRLGPYAFRLACDAVESGMRATGDATLAPGSMIERPAQPELDALAARRLELLMNGAALLHRAEDEASLAAALIDLALEGTGFARALVLRYPGEGDTAAVLAAKDLRNPRSKLRYSRTVVTQASAGHVVRLLPSEQASMAYSIGELGIESAVCCPITVDDLVVWCLYLDSRQTEEPPFPDAAGFCHAVARLAGLSLSNLKRGELQIRQSRLEKDLQAAQQVQALLGPPDTGQIGHVCYRMRMHPGRFVAGDLFDIFPLDDQRIAFCIGDVTGQGAGAAILMSAVLAHVRASMLRYASPVEVVRDVNEYICDRSELFVSLMVGIFDRTEQCLRYVDAGHGHWVFLRPGQAAMPAPRPNGLLVGVDRAFIYECAEIPATAMDRAVLYSDGVVEHLGEDNEPFGQERLIAALEGSPGPDEDVARAFGALDAFLGNHRLGDDTTLVSIQIQP